MGKAKAILFDFDGVLAKTMEDNFEAWKAALKDYGVDIQPEDYYPMEGLNVCEIPAHLFGRYGREVPDVSEVVRKKEAYYLKNHHFELYPGVLELLEALRDKKVRTAVVTAGLRDRLAGSCPPGFLERFDAIVTSNELAEGKPSPVPYLYAAAKLKLSSGECIVVENAPLGVRSAKQAGIYCIALCTTMGKQYLTGADEIWDSFEDLRRSDRVRELLS